MSDDDLPATTKALLQSLRSAKKVSGAELLQICQRNADACEAHAAALEEVSQRLRVLLDEAWEQESNALLATPGGRGFGAGGAPSSGGASPAYDDEEPARAEGFSMLGDVITSFFSFGGAEPSSPLPFGTGSNIGGNTTSRFDEGLAAWACPAGNVANGQDPPPVEVELESLLQEFSVLNRGCSGLVRRTTKYLPEVDKLSRRLVKLRPQWALVRANIIAARDSGEPMAVSNLNWTLQEATSWCRACKLATRDLSNASDLLEKLLDWEQNKQEDKERWRQLSESILITMAPRVAARTSACLWLRNVEGVGEASLLSGTQALTKNIEAARSLELRLVKAAGLIMRCEPDADIVQRAVQRFARLRSRLVAVIESAERAKKHLDEGRGSGDEDDEDDDYRDARLGDFGDARGYGSTSRGGRRADVLKRLAIAMDKAAKPLRPPPELDADGYLSEGSRQKQCKGWKHYPPRLLLELDSHGQAEAAPSDEDTAELRNWLRTSFLRACPPGSSSGRRCSDVAMMSRAGEDSDPS